jgi:hypothetical protein
MTLFRADTRTPALVHETPCVCEWKDGVWHGGAFVPGRAAKGGASRGSLLHDMVEKLLELVAA